MHVGVAGPVTLPLLRHLVAVPGAVPRGYGFPNTASLVLALRDRGHDVSVFALDRDVDRPSVHRGDGLTIYVSPMRARARDRALDLFAAERRGLAEAMGESGCQVVHAHWTYEFALAAQQSRLPTVVTAHDEPLMVARQNRHLYWWIRAVMAARAVHGSRTLTAVAPTVATHLRRWYGYRRPITVIPNGLPDEILHRTAPSAAAPDVPTFVTIAHGWSRLKNVETALRAFALFRREHPGARYLLFGAGLGPGEEGQAYAEAAGVADGCEFRGQVAREALMDVLTGGVTALLHPSRGEAHSLAVAEAMAAGLCVIGGARSGGVPWTLDHGRAGLLVDVDDPRALAEGMSHVVADPGLRTSLAHAARDRAARDFAMSRVVERYEALYERSAGGL